MSISPFTLLLIAGMIQGYILGAILIINKKKRSATSLVLSILFLILSTILLIHIMGHQIKGFEINHQYLTTSLIIITPIILYLYTRTMITEFFRLYKCDIWSGILILSSIFYGVILMIEPGLYDRIQFFLIIRNFLFCFSVFVYPILSLRLIFKFRKDAANKFSNLEMIRLNWLVILLFLFILFWITIVIGDILFRNMNWDNIFIICAIILFIIANYGFIQPEIYAHTLGRMSSILQKSERIITGRYKKSGLSDDLCNSYRLKLEKFMNNQKEYLDPELSLHSLSEKTKIPSHHLSQVINTMIGLTFYEYINRMRLEEAKNLLRDKTVENESIAVIAFRSGFASLTTFNTTFKKHTGITPSQYKNSL